MLGFLGGTGEEGRGLALRLGLAGEPVMVGSRDAARAAEAAEDLRARGLASEVYGGLNEEVAERADTALITVPFPAQRALLGALRERLEGKVVVDAAVSLSYSNGRFDLLSVKEGSAALEAQAILPGSRVVAAFQTISARDLLNSAKPVEGDVVTCSDDQEARTLVMALVERIPSLRAVDGGGLDNSRYVEGITPLLLNINRLYKARSAIRLLGI